MKKEILWILLILLFGCNSAIKKNDYLKKVSKNLDQIKSASYFSSGIASVPGDTAKFSEPRELFYEIFINPSDTLVGSSSATFSADDTTKMTDFYNGTVREKFIGMNNSLKLTVSKITHIHSDLFIIHSIQKSMKY